MSAQARGKTTYTSRPRKVPYSELTEESIRCRIEGHRWKPYNAHRILGAFETEEICERCRSIRHSIISNRGEVLKRSMKYAENYLSKEGYLGTDDRHAMRLQVITWDFPNL